MATTIDSAGRVVIPKAARDAAGLAPGTPVDVIVREGYVEIRPQALRVRRERKGRIPVLVPVEDVGPLTQDDVDAVIRGLRSGDRS